MARVLTTAACAGDASKTSLLSSESDECEQLPSYEASCVVELPAELE